MTWGGAQWVLLGWWGYTMMAVPLFRWALLHRARNELDNLAVRLSGKPVSSWPEFWGRWKLRMIERIILAIVLAWGGFW